MSLPNPTFIGQQATVAGKTYEAVSIDPPAWKGITTGTTKQLLSDHLTNQDGAHTASAIHNIDGSTAQDTKNLIDNLLTKDITNPSGGKLSALGAAIRYTDVDGLHIISDSTHAEIGITSVEMVDDYTIRVNYDNYSKVGTLILCPDEVLAIRGVVSGASVGVNSATFALYAPLRFTANGAGAITNIDPLWSDAVSLNVAGTNSVIFNVPDRLNTNLPTVSNVSVSNSTLGNLAVTSWSKNAIKITNYSQSSKSVYARVSYSSANSVFSVSNASAGINISSAVWDATTKELVITHSPFANGTGNRQVTASLGNNLLMPVVSYLTQNTSETRIKFINIATGTKQETEINDMDIVITADLATTLTTESAIDAGTLYTIDCGYCKIPISALGKVSLSNLWLFGVMNA